MHYGYNIIGTYGQVLPFVIIAIMGYFSFFRANLRLIDLMYNLLLAMTCYFLVATTVHPWYIVTLVLLSVFTQKRFALLWSYTIIMSYAAYSGTTFTEQNAILVIEYAVLILFVLFENRIRSSACFIKL